MKREHLIVCILLGIAMAAMVWGVDYRQRADADRRVDTLIELVIDCRQRLNVLEIECCEPLKRGQK